MKEKVYKLDERVPIELSTSLCKYVDERIYCEEKIKEYTDKWVNAQEDIIRITEVISKLKDEDLF